MGKVTAEHSAARRTQILQAALHCFSRDGIQPTTVANICSEAGLSVGAVYSYFKSKDRIIEALAEASRDQLSAFLKHPRDTKPDGFSEVIAQLLRGINDPAGTAIRQLDVQLWSEAIRSRRLNVLVKQARANLIEGLSTLVTKPTASRSELPPKAVAELLTAVATGFEALKALDESIDLEPAILALAALLRRSFTAGGR